VFKFWLIHLIGNLKASYISCWIINYKLILLEWISSSSIKTQRVRLVGWFLDEHVISHRHATLANLRYENIYPNPKKWWFTMPKEYCHLTKSWKKEKKKKKKIGIPFLASGVPYLSLDELITNSYIPVSKFNPYSWLRI